MAHRGSAYDKCAVGDRGGQGLMNLRLLKNVARANGGTRFSERDLVRIYQAQIAKSEVAHRACGRPDIQGITRRH